MHRSHWSDRGALRAHFTISKRLGWRSRPLHLQPAHHPLPPSAMTRDAHGAYKMLPGLGPPKDGTARVEPRASRGGRGRTGAVRLATLRAGIIVGPIAVLSRLHHVIHALRAPAVAPAATRAGGVTGAIALLADTDDAVTASRWDAAAHGSSASDRGRRHRPAHLPSARRRARDRERHA
jgi:hypothetical protein